MSIDSPQFSGYAIEQEDRQEIERTQTDASMLMLGDLPERVDPRKHPLAAEQWLQVENQGSIGSCQGQSLTECAEYCYTVATGVVLQFSRMFAYIVSQLFDGIRGDRGSTLNGGTKTSREVGLCEESIAPYPRSYPGHGYVTEAMKQNAAKYRLKTHTVMRSADQIKQFIGSGVGIVQIGISWGNEMTPDSSGCIRRFTGRGGGGHAVVFAGYVPDADVGQRSTKGYWLLLKNSWGNRWGVNGYAYVDPAAVDQMLAHRWTVMIGRSDMDVPQPRPIPVDFTKPGASAYG